MYEYTVKNAYAAEGANLKWDISEVFKTIRQIIVHCSPVFRIRMDTHKDMPPGSGSAWTDPDPGGKKA